MGEIALESVGKIYEGGAYAVKDLNLNIADGEFMVFVGPSGCGKSTALRMIAGLEAITEGDIRIGGQIVNDVPPKDRDIAMVFQNYALYPHMTVYENMAFALKLAKVDKKETERRVHEAARILDLQDYLARKPRALSGGQRQRVAMGRAIVRKPQGFLMDEPLSNLDAKLRVQMRAEIARIQDDLRVTTVYVTHDQVEAMTMGDRVAVLRKGLLQQVGTPKELFDHPNNLFVAGFIGSPSMNLVASPLASVEGKLHVSIGGQRMVIPDEVVTRKPGIKGFADKEVIVGIRPQDFEDATLARSASDSRLSARIDLVEALGTQTLLHFVVDAPPVLTEDVRELAADVGGDQVDRLEQQAASGRNDFVADVDPRSEVRNGDNVELVVDTSQLHFFDPQTGQGIYR